MQPNKTIFADIAPKYAEIGLSILPCGKNKGKAPLVKWKHLQEKHATQRVLNNWCDKFPNANIGIILGEISNLTVVDDDGNRDPHEVFELFGYTPIYVKTPSKGGHYYYRNNGEPNSRIANQNYEIKSKGSFVLATPSFSPVKQLPYDLVSGGFDIGFQDDLPTINTEALSFLGCNNKSMGLIAKGSRNTELFDCLRAIAPQCHEYDAFFKAACDFNKSHMQIPLNDTEVEKTAKSVWRYKISGNLIQPNQQYAMTALHDIDLLSPNEHWLLNLLKANHSGLRQSFILSIDGMHVKYANKMGKKAFREARKGLIDCGYITQVYKGGKGNKDPSIYTFSL